MQTPGNSNRRPRRILLQLLMLAFAVTGSGLAENEPAAIPLWPQGPPDKALVHHKAESVENRDNSPIPGGRNRIVSDVGVASLQVFPAPGEGSPRAAVVVFPGGGFKVLAIDKEGYDEARMLNAAGVTAIVVKYRTRPAEVEGNFRETPQPMVDAIMSDGRRAVRMVRQHAAEWGIDPQKIGVMGFSAGGYMAITTATSFDSGKPGAEDPTERFSSRPDFVGLVYGAMPVGIDSRVTAETPPVFMANGGVDKVTPAASCVSLYQTLRQAGVATELHLFTEGDHGFGMGRPGSAVSAWPGLFIAWLRETEVLPPTDK